MHTVSDAVCIFYVTGEVMVEFITGPSGSGKTTCMFARIKEKCNNSEISYKMILFRTISIVFCYYSIDMYDFFIFLIVYAQKNCSKYDYSLLEQYWD